MSKGRINHYIKLGRYDMGGIADMTAADLSLAVHGGQVSCVEVMGAYLSQIERLNPLVNAIVALRDRDALLKEAKEKDKRLRAGIDDGWLHGFPQAIKDLEDTAGIVTTYGSAVFKDHIPLADSLLVARMKKAGAIIIGKTNTPEFGYGSQTYNKVYGATGNPYDPGRTSGGSSGGAAAAVALNMQAVADGSDVMGSLRNPAGWCNIYGFRPSWGRVPVEAFDLFTSSTSAKGPMARTVPDLALLLGTLSGYDSRAPFSLADEADFKTLTARNIHDRLDGLMLKGRKIAWLGDWDGYLPMEEGVLSLCEEALKIFPELGVAVERIQPPYDPEKFWREIWLPFRHYGALSNGLNYDDEQKRALLKPEALYEHEGCARYGARDMYKAAVCRSDFYRAVVRLFETYDYIAVPTAQVFAFDKNIHWPREIAGRKMDTYHRWMEVTTHWTMSLSPVAALPAGFNQEGLSMGIQLVGRPRGDWELLRTAYAYERAGGFTLRRPPLLAA